MDNRMDIKEFKENVKNNKFDNCYIFCGYDEKLIKENINFIVNKVVDKNFKELNYAEFDGNEVEDIDKIINACETLPFMSEKKVVYIYRANFLGRKEEKKYFFQAIKKYLDNISPQCILIMSYVFDNKREKINAKIRKLNKKANIVEVKIENKFKNRVIKDKIKEYFKNRDKEIGNVELQLFYTYVKNFNLSIIENEVEKICCYSYGREICKEDIKEMFLKNNEDDIFDLINFISNKQVKEALNILNELIYKGQKINYILAMIEKQFKLLFNVKYGVESGKNKNMLVKELGLHPYKCEITIRQCKKFTLKQIKKGIELCLNCDERIKNFSINQKIELELLIINIIALKI